MQKHLIAHLVLWATGTATKTTHRGRPTEYVPSRGQAVYYENRKRSGRKKSKPKQAKNVRIFGRSIDERPDIVKLHLEIGHWEIDTIVGKRKGKEAVVLTLVEKVTHKFIAIKIRRKDVASVKAALRSLKIYYGSQFATVFKTITADNGTEFAELSQLERYGIMVYFAHPYSSYERAQNERHNRIFRKYVPKGKSIENYSAEQIVWFAEDMNSLPRKSLGYDTPDDLFEAYLDTVYAA
ncbi:IS30 family transposase [Veillonella caviae]|uniref:IS30 family transposase n=1 Tax=Veillonella caviae TaxID=248316 RepID=UPI0038B2DC42